MKQQNQKHITHRRGFIGTLLGGAAAFGLSSIVVPLKMDAAVKLPTEGVADAEKWFDQVKGKHKMVFDMTRHHDGQGIGWALTLMDTYNDMGTEDKDLSIVLILRSGGMPFAFYDPIWKKYEFGKRVELKDPTTKAYTLKNPFAKCKTEDDDCIELLLKRGGLVCVCNHAVEGTIESLSTLYKLKKEDVQKDFSDNLIPGIQLVPSGIWALNHAQELGCTFCFAG